MIPSRTLFPAIYVLLTNSNNWGILRSESPERTGDREPSAVRLAKSSGCRKLQRWVGTPRIELCPYTPSGDRRYRDLRSSKEISLSWCCRYRSLLTLQHPNKYRNTGCTEFFFHGFEACRHTIGLRSAGSVQWNANRSCIFIPQSSPLLRWTVCTQLFSGRGW